VSVLVLEAGKMHVNDPKIDMPVQFGATFGDPEVWRYNLHAQPTALHLMPYFGLIV
jgi:hypothetical protein